MAASPWILLVLVSFQTRNAQFVRGVNVDGLEGHSVLLKCNGTAQDNDVTWYLPPFSERHVIATRMANGDFKLAVNTNWSTFSLQIDERGSLFIPRLDYRRDNRAFYCDNGPQRTKVELTVCPNPIRLTLSNEFVKGGKPFLNVTRGMPLNVNCTPDSSFPDFNFTWALDGRVLRRTHGLQSGVTLKAGVVDHEATLECRAEYPHWGKRKTKTQQAFLNVLYIAPSVRSTVSILQGRNVDLRCNISGNPPPSFSWWRIHGDQSEELPGNSDTYSMTSLNKSQAGTYECKARNDVGNSTKSVNLIVEYPPEASVTFNHDLLALECLADGIPNDFYFRPWKHILGDVTLEHEHSAKQDKNIYRLFLPESLNAMGLYICKVGNFHGIATAAFFFRPKCKPRFGHGAFRKCIRNKTGVVVPFYAYPEFTNLSWRAHSGETIHDNTTHVMENVNVEIAVHGRNVKILGQAVVWDSVVDVPESFTVTVTNSVGSSRLRLTVCEGSDGSDGGIGPLKTAVIVSAVLVALVLVALCLYVVRQKAKAKQAIRQQQKVDLALADLAALCNSSMSGSRFRLAVARSHSSLTRPYTRAGEAGTAGADGASGEAWASGTFGESSRIYSASASDLPDEDRSAHSTLRVPLGSRGFPTTLEGLLEQINRSSFTSSLSSVSVELNCSDL